MEKDPSHTEAEICGEIARRHDPDRFVCAMFLPQKIRDAAFAVIALNSELAKALLLPVSGPVTGPMAGLIRLQWWRDMVQDPQQGRQSRHEVAVAIAGLLEAGILDSPSLLTLIDAREAELCRFPDWATWRAGMRDGSGMIQRMTADLLGVGDEAMRDAVTNAGAAFGTGLLLRYLPQVLRSGRMPLPDEALDELGLPPETEGGALPEHPEFGALLERLRQEGRRFLPDSIMIRRGRLAMLPAVIAQRDLRRGPVEGPDAVRGIGDRLTVMFAGLLRR